MKKIMPISQKTSLADILKKPGAEEILVKYNVPCLACPYAKYELESLTVGHICKAYKINLKALLKELNKL